MLSVLAVCLALVRTWSLPDILVLDLWSVLDTGGKVSNCISLILLNCLSNKDSMSGGSLAYCHALNKANSWPMSGYDPKQVLLMTS